MKVHVDNDELYDARNELDDDDDHDENDEENLMTTYRMRHDLILMFYGSFPKPA